MNSAKAGLFLFIIALFIGPKIYGQEIPCDKLDMSLTSDFRKMISKAFGHGYENYEEFDSLQKSFKGRILSDLATKTSFDCKLDSLNTEIRIIQSEDKLLRVFSWDELSGGTWHDMASFAQFKTTTGNIHVRQLDTEREVELSTHTDVVINKIHQIKIGHKTHYLLIGWGTHGAGHHHMTAQIFSIVDEKLVKCTTCFESGEDLVVESARSYPPKITYNPATGEITHNEFVEGENSGFLEPTGKVITLKLKNGKFQQ